ncbi:U-box domain-containing protein 29 [Ananas comosus]|uniref:U-box domain-containing protein n=1 Tax=Ananas comosus TaxID=4615 RepID=A0A199UDQ9_ANACO|nr:U-box domain-containing protein 29 [Ananas comosus]
MGQPGAEQRPRRRRLPEPLEVRLPPLFRCPISLEVMRSPVSLCTGVTYDRSSIQRWLDSGHRTCPATRLPLPSTHLVPNLALRRLILSAAAEDDDGGGRSDPSAAEIASRIAAAGEGGDSEAAVRVLALMLGSDRVGKGDKESAIAALVADLDRSVSALLAVVRNGRGIGSRIDAVRVLESILASPARVCGEESRAAIAEREELFPELVMMMGEGGAAAEAAIGCMAAAAAAGKRRARARMVGAGRGGAGAGDRGGGGVGGGGGAGMALVGRRRGARTGGWRSRGTRRRWWGR